MKDCIWTSKVALSRSGPPLRAIRSIFWNLKVKRMNKNTCDLGVISHRRARSGRCLSSFVSARFFEPGGQSLLSPSQTQHESFKLLWYLVRIFSMANTFRSVTSEDVTITLNPVNQQTCNSKMLVDFDGFESKNTYTCKYLLFGTFGFRSALKVLESVPVMKRLRQTSY